MTRKMAQVVRLSYTDVRDEKIIPSVILEIVHVRHSLLLFDARERRLRSNEKTQSKRC